MGYVIPRDRYPLSPVAENPMSKTNNPFLFAAFIVFTLLAYLPIARADIPGITLTDAIDPSLGTDAFGLLLLQVNHTTHKLYTAGYPSDSTRNFGLKVVDTTSNTIVAGIDLGRYAGSYNGFWPIGLAIDESGGPAGDRVYMIGRTDSVGNAILRVVDGSTNTNLTGETTDLFLPVGVQEFTSLAVNSSNHKIYVAKESGEIAIVDGPNQQILGTVNPNFGDLVVANPAANKIFVVNHNGGGVINSADDTFAPLSLFFTATAAALDSIHGRIYFVGRNLGNSNSIFAVDAITGQIVGSKTGLANLPASVTVKPDENTVYVGSATDLLAFDGTDFTPKGSFARPALKLACDSTVPAGLFFVDTNPLSFPAEGQPNSVIAMTFATSAMAPLTMGYRPFDVAVNNRTNRIYVTDHQTNELLAIDGSSHAVLHRILITRPWATQPPLMQRYDRHLAISERLNRVYLPRTSLDSQNEYRSFLDVVDGETNQVRGSIALDPTIGYFSDRVAVDDMRRRIYVTAARQVSSGSVQVMLVVYDADTELPMTTIDLGESDSGTLFGVAANPVTGRVYVSIEPGVVIVDGNTNTKVGTVNSARGEIAINRRRNKVYAVQTRYVANSVAVINGATDSLETSFSVLLDNDFISALDVDEVTNRVYVAGGSQYALGGWVTAYDANNNYQLLGQIDLQTGPAAGMAFAGVPRQLFVAHNLDGAVSVLQDATPGPADLFGNISTRTYVADGDNVLIGGFILGGTSPNTKRVLIRAIGPSLTQFGVAGVLPDTTLEVHASGNVTTNDNWKINDTTGLSQQAEIEATSLPPGNDLESALVMTLPAGQSATAIVRGRNGAPGVGLVEVYDLEHGSPAKLLNISTRGHVGDGENVMIAGAIVLGSKSAQVVVRAIGPSLTGAGLPNPLEDPVLELHDPNGVLIAVNDNWQEHEAEVTATTLAPTDPRESVIVATLFPANYTAIARGKNGATGVALVEAYYLSQ